MLLVLALLKLTAYFLVLRAAPRFLHVSPMEPEVFALSWALLRMLLGLLLGLPAFYAVGLLQSIGMLFALAYGLVLVPSRILAWSLLAAFIQRRYTTKARPRLAHWVAIGLLASFAVDGAALLLGVQDIKLFC